jgi:MarR family transcriptional regulator, organic hydroperoxide resistance regulator
MGRRDVAVGSLTVALHQALARVSQRVEEATAREGLSLPQWLVVSHLAERGERTMGELVAATGLNDSTLTRVVDRLASLGLLYREVDPADRRRVRVSLGVRGRELHDRLAPEVAERESALVDDLDGLDGPDLVEALSRLGGPGAS